jgi:phosphoribosylformimino-5-aminoimidazole carboxamide ribotide isomerase
MRTRFEVIPAIDLLADDAVRLEQGDFERVFVRASPFELVERFVAAGAQLIHVVDLDGARTGQLRPERIRELAAAAAPARIQASGGIRSVADAQLLLEAGAGRVLVGTAAFAELGALERFANSLGEQLVVALDVRDGRIAVSGWEATTGLTAEEAARACHEAGVPRLHCTAVERDGTLSGPDLDLLGRVLEASALPVIAAGGIRSEADLDALAALGCEAAVVGRALLDGTLGLDVLAS